MELFGLLFSIQIISYQVDGHRPMFNQSVMMDRFISLNNPVFLKIGSLKEPQVLP